MSATLTHILPQLSDALAAQVAAAAPMVTAIRVGPNRHIAGIVWREDVVVTSDQALPAQESYSLAMASGALLPARTARRDPATNLVWLSLDTPTTPAPIRSATDPAVGALVLALGAAADGSATMRLSAIHRISQASSNLPLGAVITLDLGGNLLAEGGPVLDARGGLLGMASSGPGGEAQVVPYATIARFLEPLGMAMQAAPVASRARRGWLGLALQPITVPETLRPIAGQTSGRMVVSVTAGGPAEHAGLRLGDVLLAIDGQSVSGQHGLRDFLSVERIGSKIEVRLMREGAVRSQHLTIAPQPQD